MEQHFSLTYDSDILQLGTYYLHDALGSTIRIINEQTGNGSLRIRYDVFGKPYFAHESTPNNYNYYPATTFRFFYTGREMLVSVGSIGAGLMDYRNRIYSTTLGRFLQPDPIGFDARDVNWYRYVGNDVVNYMDPEGLAYQWSKLKRCVEGDTKSNSEKLAEHHNTRANGTDTVTLSGSATITIPHVGSFSVSGSISVEVPPCSKAVLEGVVECVCQKGIYNCRTFTRTK